MTYPSPRKLQLRRGNTAQISSYTGPIGEIVINTDTWALYVQDGTTVGGHIVSGGGGGTVYSNANVLSYLTSFNGNIIPSANVTYTLGNITHQWKSLYVSNNTIYINGVPLTVDASGNLSINGSAISTVAYVNTQVANVDLTNYALNANVTAANVGLKGYVDQANTIQSAQVGAANLAITAANVGMKGYVDSQSFYSNSKVATYLATGPITISNVTISDNYGSQWRFTDTELQLPSGNGAPYGLGPRISSGSGIQIYPSNDGDFMVQTYATGLGGSRQYTFTPSGNITLSDGGNIVSDYNIGIYSGTNVAIATTGGTWLFDNNGRLTVPDGGTIGVVSTTSFDISYIGDIKLDNSGGTWTFGTDGKFTLPGSSAYLEYSSDILFIDPGSTKSVVVGDAGGMVYWNFNSLTGNLIFPDSSQQTTAWTGTVDYTNVTNAYSNVQVGVYTNLSTYAYAANVTAANVGIIGYIDQANTIQAAAIVAANVGLKGYVDSRKNFDINGGFINFSASPAIGTDGITFNDGSFQTTAYTGYGNTQMAAYANLANYAWNSNVSGSSYSNVQVATYLPTYSGNIANVRLGVSGVLTFPDGTTQTTAASGGGSNYGNANVASYLITNGYVNTNSAYGNGNVTAYTVSMGFTNYSNVNVQAYLSGSVTGIVPASAYSNNLGTNVKPWGNFFTYNMELAGGYLKTGGTGGISGQVLKSTGDVNPPAWSNIADIIAATTGQITIANIKLAPSGNIVFADGTTQTTNYSNVQVIAYLNATGYNLYSNANVSSYLPLYGGDISARNITVSGNIALTGNVLQINSAVFYGNTITGFSALYAGIPGYTPIPQVVAQFTENYNGYAQINSQNLGTGNQASTDFIATANNGTDSAYFVDFGIAGSGYDPSVAANNNAIGTALTPNDAYLYTAGNTAANGGGNLVIGVQTLNKNIRFFAGGVNANNVVLTIQGNGITTAGNVTGTYFIGSGQFLTGLPTAYSNVNVQAYTETMAFKNYSNVNVAAYLNATGYNLYSNVNVAAYLNTQGYNLYSNVNVASYLSTATITTTGNITAQYLTGNINLTGNVVGTSANVTLQAGGNTWIFDNQGNLTLPANADIIGAVTFTGNVTAPYFIGNGALLTGIAASSNYSNVNVATYLPTYSGNVANVRLGVSGVLTFADGTTQITAGGGSYSNVQVATYLPTYSGNVANIRLGIAGVLTFADGTTMTSAAAGTYSNVQVATYLPTYTGSINAANILVTGANIAFANVQAQFIATNTATGALRVMGGVGVGGTVFAANLNSPGNLTVSLVNAGNINAAGNVLAQNVIGTLATASQTNITAVGTLGNLTVTGNVTSSNFVGLTPNVQLVANTSVTTFDIYGNVTFPGNNIISSMGITMPTRPAFRVNGTSLYAGAQSTANVNLKGVAVSTQYNQGNYFDATTGKFTAPVAGIYEVLLNARVNGSYNGLAQLVVLKNGNNSSGNVIAFWETTSNAAGATHFGVNGTVQLAVGDYLSANILSGNVTFDANDNWSVTYLG